MRMENWINTFSSLNHLEGCGAMVGDPLQQVVGGSAKGGDYIQRYMYLGGQKPLFHLMLFAWM